MGTNQVMMLLLLLPVFYYHAMATASSGRLPQTALPLVELEHKTVEAKGEVKHLSSNENGETVIAHHGHGRKLQYAAGTGGRGTGGGQLAGNGGGGSNTPYTPGGAGAIPAYGAGGGANIHRNNNHHSAGSCIHSCRRYPALSAILLAYLLINTYVFVY
ncbi:glycine-rich cell wall structural protein-like [Coffea eugenioides]|uniref:glycine-rich cell wall structural protein-like n=1 Tax=Coffea eugenioides TaxID=49369 RepID=UPI000F60F6BC|nr:glycine-rich cell wall structural protein-like [Coffea eugenioides]